MKTLLLLSTLFLTVNSFASDQPNIVLLFADDQRSGTLNLGGAGNPDTITPNLDRLAATGRLFRNAYVFGSDRSSVCYPSRAQLLSGKNLFSYRELDLPSTSRDDMNLPAALRIAGYQTFRSGKANNVPYGINMEFDVNIERANRGSVAGNLGYFQDAHDFLDRKSVKGLGDTEMAWDGESPFFLYIAVGTPHEPYPRDEATEKMYADKPISLPADVAVRHGIVPDLPRNKPYDPAPWGSVEQELRSYYGSITFMDRLFGDLVKKLKAKGVYENTIFVFAGDNGLSIGSHGIDGKSNLFEFGGMHVPLIFAGPGIEPGESDALVYLTDIYPTLMSLIGEPVPASVDGSSLAPILTDESEKVRDVLLTAFSHESEQRTLRDSRWKLHWYPAADAYELYDLSSDPRELNDLSGDPEFSDELARMKALLEAERKRLGDPYPQAARIQKKYTKARPAPVGIEPLLSSAR